MGREGVRRAFDHVLQAADLDPGCARCGGARRTNRGLITTINRHVLPTCPECGEFLNEAGRAVAKRLEDGDSSLKHINAVIAGEPPREVRSG